MTGNGHLMQEELASYAMRNLPPEESLAIRKHLETCAQCRQELAQICGDLALLGIAVEQHALPEGARQRFLDRIASTPIAAEEKPAPPTPTIVQSTRRRPGFWIPWAAAAAMAIVAVVLAVQNYSLNQELSDQLSLVTRLAGQASRAQQVLEVLTAPNAQHVLLTESKAAAQPTARATYLPERGGLILLATDLKPLPADKDYELWLIPADGKPPVPAGTFRPDSRGAATLVLPSIAPGLEAKAFGVTVEKAGGSQAPTSPIILSGAPTGS